MIRQSADSGPRIPAGGGSRTFRFTLFFFLGLSACARGPVPVTVTATLPDGEPLAAVEIVALPYDAPALLDSLARAAPRPRPRFDSLETALRDYVPPDPGDLGPAGRAWQATRDSAERLADSLRTVDRRTAGYPAAYHRFRGLYRRLTDRTAARDAVYRSVTAEVRSLADSAAAAADTLRAWEEEAYAAFDSLVEARLAASGRGVERALTDVDGRAELELGPGRWRVVLRQPLAENPFLQYVWEVPVVVRGRWPLRVPLFARNLAVRWRY